jgi:hypothetical protein
MKKTTFYKIGALSLALLGAGVFSSFDDGMTAEQKIEAAYNEMVIEYKAEKAELCKSQALAMAQAEWARMQQNMATGGDVEEPMTGGSRGDRPVSGGNGGEEPTTSGNDYNTNTNPKSDKMSNNKNAVANDKSDKMNRNADTKAGVDNDVTNKKKNKMSGGK